MTDFNDPRIAVIEVTPCWAGSLPIDKVDEALKAAGVDEKLLPKAPTRAQCMRRAFDNCAPRGARIDSLPKGLGVAMSLKDVEMLDLEALALQTGSLVREAASYHATLTAKILVENINGTEVETLSFTPDDHPMVPLVRETYRAMREQYKASEDLSLWFSQTVIPSVGGVGKRSRGGVYYVPSHRRQLLLAVAAGLEAVSLSEALAREVNGVSYPVYRLTLGGKLCLEPRYADDSAAMEILVDGVIRNTDAALDDLAGALDVQDGKRPLGRRALASKREACAQLETQMKAWEAVCSVSLELLRNRLGEIEAGIGLAELAAEAASKDE